MAVGYGRLSSATAQNARDVKEARDEAAAVRNALIVSDAARNSQITTISVNVAETRKDIYYMSEQLKEVLVETRRSKK